MYGSSRSGMGDYGRNYGGSGSRYGGGGRDMYDSGRSRFGGGGGMGGGGMGGRGDQRSGRGVREFHSTTGHYVYMRGLPYSSSEKDIFKVSFANNILLAGETVCAFVFEGSGAHSNHIQFLCRYNVMSISRVLSNVNLRGYFSSSRQLTQFVFSLNMGVMVDQQETLMSILIVKRQPEKQ
jgi:hypothetical protein